MAKFTVDTHLFRELGELLVGRDSTALIEIMKNSYDADATEVIVDGQSLDQPASGRIVITDNGTGMTSHQFETGFLRVASRLRDQGERRSTIFRRRYTGAKGIGRLAAHKLAKMVEIDSIPEAPNGQQRKAVHAIIDWDKIEQCETLDEIEGANAITVDKPDVRPNASSGTTLVLTKLRRAWTQTERARFFAEVQSFQPPQFLRDPLPRSVLDHPLLFDTPTLRDEQPGNRTPTNGWDVRLEGDFAGGDEYWELFAQRADWVIEIRAASGSDNVYIAISPTKRTLRTNPEARELEMSIPHPDPTAGPFFDARILVREGRLGSKQDQRVWAARTSGVRVYMEGFRVLPYGEPKDDWLSLDYEYTRRARQLEMLEGLDTDIENTDSDEGLLGLPNNHYIGGVFLTQERASTLRIVVNREGFVPESGFDTLVNLVRTAIHLCTRARAAAASVRREERKAERGRSRKTETGSEPAPEKKDITEDESPERRGLLNRLGEAADLIQKARSHMSQGEVDAAQDVASEAFRKIEETTEAATETISEHALLRVLASVGTQMAAFVHEINALLGASQTIEQALSRTLDDPTLSRDKRRTLRQIRAATTDLKHGLERHASYLTDVVTPDARRRRSRQRFAECFDAAVKLVQHQAERRRIEIENTIPPDLKSRPMFRAELTTVFANLLTNAVKAAGKDGRISAEASGNDERVTVCIQNTGIAVNLAEATRWFRAFESTTAEVDPVLGQGMGLGLTITRNVLESYGAMIQFVEPNAGFSTAVEISFPK